MMIRNPALIIRLLRLSTSRNSRSISPNDRDLILGRNGSFGTSGRTLSALATFSSAFGLWEEGCDPGLVDEIEGTSEGGEEEEVKENTI